MGLLVLDGVSQLGRARHSHTARLHIYTCCVSSRKPASTGECIKEHVNDNKGTCGARKILPCLLVKRVDGKAATGATPCSQAVRQRSVVGQGEIDHLVKMETCREKKVQYWRKCFV